MSDKQIKEILFRIKELEIRADVSDRQWSAAYTKWNKILKEYNTNG